MTFHFNQYGVCTNPKVIPIGRKKSCTAEVRLAKNDGVWFYGYNFEHGGCSDGCGSACAGVGRNRKGAACATQQQALLEALNIGHGFFSEKPQRKFFLPIIEHAIQAVQSGSFSIPESPDMTDLETNCGDGNFAPSPITPDPAAEYAAGPVVQHTNAIDQWSNIRRWVDLAGKFERCKLACQVMAGFELIVAHGANEISVGNTHRRIGYEPWKEIVKREAGISEMTALRWMKMAEAVQPRLSKLGSEDRLRQLIATPVADWTVADSQLVESAVQKIADGKTQLDFMRELGLVRGPLPRGGANTPRGADGKLLRSARRGADQIQVDDFKAEAAGWHRHAQATIDGLTALLNGEIHLWDVLDESDLPALRDGFHDLHRALATCITSKRQ